MFLGRETLEDHSQLPKNAVLGRLQAFCKYGGIGMSTSSQHFRLLQCTPIQYNGPLSNRQYVNKRQIDDRTYMGQERTEKYNEG